MLAWEENDASVKLYYFQPAILDTYQILSEYIVVVEDITLFLYYLLLVNETLMSCVMSCN